MDGYTATEEVLDNERVVDKEVKLIMATQKTLGGPDESYKYYETFEASLESIQNSSSGYGYEVNSEIKYSNELLQNALDLGINDSVELSLEGDSRIIDSTLDYEVSESSKFKIPLESNGSGIVEGNHVMKYQLPEIFMQDKTGDTYTSKQVEDLGLDDVVEAGNKLYIPIWIDEIGQYDLLHTNHESMGSNHVSFELTNTLDIDCYMLNHIGSDTQELDVLLLHPLNKSNKLFDKFGQ